MKPKIYSSAYPLDTTGKTLMTKQLQQLIDLASEQEACLVLEQGVYLTSSLFLKSNMELYLAQGTVLLGTTDEAMYPLIDTRVAGIEMEWYGGILNCIGQENVIVSGPGTIDGQGPYWWGKYWGEDGKGGMRQEYDRQGLRWACDYDCKRVRNVVVSHSHQVVLKDFTSYESGFWNIHILYSQQIHIDGIKIDSYGITSPSTDGIDVDSSTDVIIEHCILACNDDNISIKSGRDMDGMRVGKPCKNIRIQHCIIKAGYGITIGSEVTGGIENIHIEDIIYDTTDCGIRIKSSYVRQGYIKNVYVHQIKLHNVKYLFHFYLDWNRNYCTCTLPANYNQPIPKHWQKLLEVPNSISLTRVSNIDISDVEASYDKDYDGISRAFHIVGYEEEPITNITFSNMSIQCKEYGILHFVKNIQMNQVSISALEQNHQEHDEFDNR